MRGPLPAHDRKPRHDRQPGLVPLPACRHAAESIPSGEMPLRRGPDGHRAQTLGMTPRTCTQAPAATGASFIAPHFHWTDPCHMPQRKRGMRQGKGMEPPMHTDAHRWSESGMAIHGDHRKTNPGERRRSGGPCPIGVHRCASVVPNSCLVARRSRLPEGLVITTSRTPCTNSAPRPAARRRPNGRTPCTRSSRPAGAAHRLARSAHETMARLARDRSVRYFI